MVRKDAVEEGARLFGAVRTLTRHGRSHVHDDRHPAFVRGAEHCRTSSCSAVAEAAPSHAETSEAAQIRWINVTRTPRRP
jgi:hypothetical protein